MMRNMHRRETVWHLRAYTEPGQGPSRHRPVGPGGTEASQARVMDHPALSRPVRGGPHAVPQRPRRRLLPRRTRRGLALFDVILAVAVLSVMALWGGQVVGDWTRERVVTGEVRGVAELARAGRLLLEGDITHAGRDHGVGTAPLDIPLVALRAAGLRAATAGTRTPGRRTLTLHLWRPATHELVIIARARGDRPLSRLPGAQSGVSGVGLLLDANGDGSLSGSEARLRGPGVDFDMGAVNTASPGFATVNDLFALEYVDRRAACRDYLLRVAVPGCPDANTMAVDLDMDGHSLRRANAIVAGTATIGRLAGPVSVTGGLTVNGALRVTGDTDMEDVTVIGAMSAQAVDITGALTVEDLTATGNLVGADLTLDGTVTVSGTARLGDAEMNRLDVETLNARQLSSDEGTFDRIFADDITATRCTGCN